MNILVISLPYWITFFSLMLVSCFLNQALARNNHDAHYKMAIIAEPHYFELSNLIEEKLYQSPHYKPRIMRFEPNPIQAQHQLKAFKQNFDLVLAIGPQALEYLSEFKPFSDELPVVSILTRPVLLPDAHPMNHSNLIQLNLDQPLYRQLNLIQTLCLQSRCVGSIGIALGPTSKMYRKELETLAENTTLPINIIEINPQFHPVETMHHLLKESMMLLTIPDESILNSRTVRGLLLSSYHNKTPLIGYSKTYVNHGALAAVYTSETQLVDETSRLIVETLKLPRPFPSQSLYTKDFSIAINPQVAKLMGFSLKTEIEIKKHMLRLENNKNGK